MLHGSLLRLGGGKSSAWLTPHERPFLRGQIRCHEAGDLAHPPRRGEGFTVAGQRRILTGFAGTRGTRTVARAMLTLVMREAVAQPRIV